MKAWDVRVYLWSEDQRTATPWTSEQEAGVKNALGTLHDVPSKKDCEGCHTMKVAGAFDRLIR